MYAIGDFQPAPGREGQPLEYLPLCKVLPLWHFFLPFPSSLPLKWLVSSATVYSSRYYSIWMNYIVWKLGVGRELSFLSTSYVQVSFFFMSGQREYVAERATSLEPGRSWVWLWQASPRFPHLQDGNSLILRNRDTGLKEPEKARTL